MLILKARGAMCCHTAPSIGMFAAVIVAMTTTGGSSSAAVSLEGKATAELAVGPQQVETRIIENGTIIRKTSKFEIRITPIRESMFQDQAISTTRQVRSDHDREIAAATCPTNTVTHSSFNFEDGGAMLLQGGFVETEIAAAEYTVDADSFPVRVDVMEKIFGTQNTTVTTTTEWSVMIWAGPPNTGTLIDVFSSDDTILPHLVIPPGTHGVNVQVIVDPNDPEPIIVPQNASNSLTIGFRIDAHNSPAASSCPCPISGTLPAVCCPPPSTLNAFPSNDVDGVSNPSRNWLWARDCPGVGPFCGVAPQGWYNFTTSGTPSGDWNIRTTYTAMNCPEGFGACCLPNGTCQILSEANCAAQNGVFQGENVLCQDVECEPIGACCYFVGPNQVCDEMTLFDCAMQDVGNYQGDGTTCDDADCPLQIGACCTESGCQELTSDDCDAADGVWLGGSTECTAEACHGACCIEATGACVDFDEATCNVVDGLWQGPSTSCDGFICFPSGACCLPDGSCIDDVSPEECEDADGEFQGDGTTCAESSCPEPIGACCVSNGSCLELIESTCVNVAGQWQGHDSDCSDTTGSGTADACEDDEDPCPADLNNDNVVDGGDLLILLSQWGPCIDPNDCPADLNDDGAVDGGDLLILLSQWGSCP